MAKASAGAITISDGTFDFSYGVDSSKVTTLQSSLNPNGLPRNSLAWLANATVRRGGVLQRTGWQPLARILETGRWQGGFIYEPDNANPYLICSISGHIYQVLLEAPFTVTELLNTIVPPWTSYGTNIVNGVQVENPQFNPDWTEMVFFEQGENYLIIQAGDYGLVPVPTLPLFWDGTTLRRSIGLTTPAPLIAPSQNEIPAATAMKYAGNRLWYAQDRAFAAGDMAGGPSGNAINHRRDSLLSVTENPLCFGGDGFTLPTHTGNIRGFGVAGNLNVAFGESPLYIFTRKAVYSLTIPTTRTDWINATSTNQPQLTVAQLVNGSVGHRCIVTVNGDLFYQSLEPAVRSLMTAVRNFGQGQWGNTSISQNEERALQFNDRSLMRFSSGTEFDNRVLMAVLPQLAGDGINIIHKGILPLDLDLVSNLQAQSPAPAWEGIWDGLNILEVFSGDFGGRERAFAVNIDDTDGSINVWEITKDQRFQNGDNRVTWNVETPAYTWGSSGYEVALKQLNGGELWIDKILGTVDLDVYFRADGEPCWAHWFKTQFCVERCEDEDIYSGYPCTEYAEGYIFPITFPEPPQKCNTMRVRPNTIGYQFQVRFVIKGWCQIRGLLLYALPREKMIFQGVQNTACPSPLKPGAMATLPSPFE